MFIYTFSAREAPFPLKININQTCAFSVCTSSTKNYEKINVKIHSSQRPVCSDLN